MKKTFKKLLLIVIIFFNQFVLAQNNFNTGDTIDNNQKGYWSFNIGANYLRPTIISGGSVAYSTDGYHNYYISPVGGFGNYIEIGKGFKIFCYTNNSSFNCNVNLSYNWTSSILKYSHYYSYMGVNYFKSGEETNRFKFPSLLLQLNNILFFNDKFGIYQAIGAKTNFFSSRYLDRIYNNFYVPYTLGFVLNVKKIRLIPIFNINIFRFWNKTDKINSGMFGTSAFKQEYFQQLDFGLCFHYIN